MIFSNCRLFITPVVVTKSAVKLPSRITEPEDLELPTRILALDKSIRFCCIVEKLGHIIAYKYREGLTPLMTYEETRKNALLSVIRHSTRQSWESKMGRTLYSITRYERLTRASMPTQNNHLLLVSFDADVNAVDRLIQEKIMPLLQEQHNVPRSARA
jgi:hypothetical protein